MHRAPTPEPARPTRRYNPPAASRTPAAHQPPSTRRQSGRLAINLLLTILERRGKGRFLASARTTASVDADEPHFSWRREDQANFRSLAGPLGECFPCERQVSKRLLLAQVPAHHIENPSLPGRLPVMSTDRLSVFPAFHKVSQRRVLVVGSGAEALAKVRLLLETDAEIRLVGESPDNELTALAARHGVGHHQRPFQPEDFDGAVLVFAASGERESDAPVVAAARAKNIPVNAVDSPDLCDFYTPAIVNRAPVAIAITSTGAGPVLAQKLRARIEAMLPTQLGALARLGDSFRGAAERVLPKGQPRRRFWSAFFEGRVADAALSGHTDEARRLASRLLTQADGEAHGFVWLIGAGPGDADLLTLRAQRILQEADVIVHDALVPETVVAMGRRDARRIKIGEEWGPRPAENDLAAILVREASAGQRVAYLDPGNPFELRGDIVAALQAAAILFDIVPGVTAPESLADARTQAA
jgi:uroporphyrin-III C-methyltransferase / precorrin-2 dehydrogenase / sirohydrochlorin ferrochelatase